MMSPEAEPMIMPMGDGELLPRAIDQFAEAEAEDVILFTVSVIDHMPYPEQALRHLTRMTKRYRILLKLAHNRIGKAAHNIFFEDESVRMQPVYRYSYFHDYRYECERKFGSICLADVRLPIGPDNLQDLYRLYVFSKRDEVRTQNVLESLRFRPD